jgi:lipase
VNVTREPKEWRVPSADITLSVFEWPSVGPAEGPPLLFAHATGLHARVWDQVIAALPRQRCFAVDQRGHGRSDKPPSPYLWPLFASDLLNVIRHFDLKRLLGVGHSLGGHAMTLAAANEPSRFGALLLIDPVILPHEWYVGSLPGEHYAARRRSHFASPETMIERFKDRLPFSRWQPAVLHDYCAYGLLPNGGEYTLACPPAVEAEIYQRSSDVENDIYPHIASVDLPVRILRADAGQAVLAQNLSASPTAPDLASHFRHGEDVLLANHSHFIPMEAPDLVAEHINQMLSRR